MQTTVYQREAASNLAVDSSIALSNPIQAGQLLAILTASGKLVYAGTASSTPIGIASADQDPDENTCDFWVVPFDIGKSAGRVYLVKVFAAVNQWAELWVDTTVNLGFATPTVGSNTIVLGRAMAAGVAQALVPVVC